MVPIFELSLRQLAGRWRLLIIFFLTSLPVGITMIVRTVGGDAPEDFIEGTLGGMGVGAIMPIVTMTLATAAFGNELEDRTLSYLLLKPVRRPFVAIPKMLASLVVAGPLLTASSVLVVVFLFAFQESRQLLQLARSQCRLDICHSIIKTEINLLIIPSAFYVFCH